MEYLHRHLSTEGTQMAEMHDKTLSVSNHSRNSKLHWDIDSHPSEQPASKKNLQTINAGEGVEKKESSYIVGVNVNLRSQYKQYVNSLKK